MTKDWNIHKRRIIRLYKTEGMTLEQVREFMIRKWNFKAGYAPPPFPLSHSSPSSPLPIPPSFSLTLPITPMG